MRSSRLSHLNATASTYNPNDGGPSLGDARSFVAGARNTVSDRIGSLAPGHSASAASGSDPFSHSETSVHHHYSWVEHAGSDGYYDDREGAGGGSSISFAGICWVAFAVLFSLGLVFLVR